MIKILEGFLSDLKFKTFLHAAGERIYADFIKHYQSPISLQKKVLENILAANFNTEFGKTYNFSKLDFETYRSAVPVNGYEDLRALIDSQIKGQASLTRSAVKCCANTSGTSGAAKRIPITQDVIDDYKRSQLLAIICQVRAVPDSYKNKILVFQGASTEGYLENQIPYGSMSGLMYENSSSLLNYKFVIPPGVSTIQNAEERLLLGAAFSLVSGKISLITTPNASTVLRMYEFILSSRESLARFCETGEIALADSKCKLELQMRWKKSTSRQSLAKLLGSKDSLAIDQIFPELKAVATWMAGNCGYFAEKLKKQFSRAPKFMELGYLASEFRGSIALDPINSVCLPTIHENFLEFAPVANWDSGDRSTILSHEIIPGEKYYIIVTTKGGLYRYFMDDIVEAQVSNYSIPSIRFVQKGSGCSSITGEKLYESQVLDALQPLVSEVSDCILIADVSSQKYKLYVESNIQNFSLAEILDKRLADINLEYKSKRDSGRLLPIEYCSVKPGTFAKRRENYLQTNSRETQYKAPKLLSGPDRWLDFEQYKLDRHES